MFLPEDLILNPKEHPDAKIGDIVEIYHPEDANYRLLLQISGFNEELKGRGEITAMSVMVNFELFLHFPALMTAISTSLHSHTS